jgi:succinate dehydrogenase / fumarate reductase cytochrome b subunit
MPLGVWTFFHLWNNLSAFNGAEAWEASVTKHAHPLAEFFTAVIVLVPLVLHTIWGIGRLFMFRANNVRYGYFANLKFLLQRLSAIGLLLFLGAHLYKAWIGPKLLEGHPESFADISHMMRTHTPTLAVYLLGVLGIAYHLANGLQTATLGWGIVSSKTGLRRLERWMWVVALVLLAMGWGTIYALYKAGE